jgi:hypothetical protein
MSAGYFRMSCSSARRCRFCRSFDAGLVVEGLPRLDVVALSRRRAILRRDASFMKLRARSPDTALAGPVGIGASGSSLTHHRNARSASKNQHECSSV